MTKVAIVRKDRADVPVEVDRVERLVRVRFLSAEYVRLPWENGEASERDERRGSFSF